MLIDYFAYQSGMKNWNAGMKVLVSVLTLCLVISVDKLTVSLFVIVTMGILTLAVGKVPVRSYLHFMTVPLFFMIVSSLAIAVQFAREPVGTWNVSMHWFYLCVTKISLTTAVHVFLKATAGMSALYMLAFSTPVHEMIFILKKMHVPRLLIELMHLIYRYIFILFEVAWNMQTAAKARLGYRNFRCSCKSFSGIAGNLFLISLKKANSYYDALISRGYEGSLEFLTEKKEIQGWQVAGFVSYFTVLTIVAFVSTV